LIFQAKYMYRTDFNYKLKYLNSLSCNGTTPVSSFEGLGGTLGPYLTTAKNEHVDPGRAPRNSSKLYRSYVNDLDEIGRNGQISLLSMDNKLPLNAAVFFVCLTSSLVIRLLSRCSWLRSFLPCATSCILRRHHSF